MPQIEAADGRISSGKVPKRYEQQRQQALHNAFSDRESLDDDYSRKKARSYYPETDRLEDHQFILYYLTTFQIQKAYEEYAQLEPGLCIPHLKVICDAVYDRVDKLEKEAEIFSISQDEGVGLDFLRTFVKHLHQREDHLRNLGDNEFSAITTPEERFRHFIERNNEEAAEGILDENTFPLLELHKMYRYVKGVRNYVEQGRGKYLSDKVYTQKISALPRIMKRISALIYHLTFTPRVTHEEEYGQVIEDDQSIQHRKESKDWRLKSRKESKNSL